MRFHATAFTKAFRRTTIFNPLNASIFFPASFAESQSAILFGKFDYQQTFASFLKWTQQKEEAAKIIGIFADRLKYNNAFFSESKPIRIADLGCADAKTAQKFIHAIEKYTRKSADTGFEYLGIDIDPIFINAAKNTLASDPIIKNHSFMLADALSGNLRDRDEIKLKQLSFDLIFVSHTAYYLKDPSSCKTLLMDILKLLSQCGIAIFLHENNTRHFRHTYNGQQFKNIGTPLHIEQTASDLTQKFNQFSANRFVSTLQFPELDSFIWRALKHPEEYNRYARVPHFVKTLEVLAFIIRRDLHSLAKENMLDAYIDEIGKAITANNNCLDLETHMQIFVRPDCKLLHNISKSLKETFTEVGKQKMIEDLQHPSFSR